MIYLLDTHAAVENILDPGKLGKQSSIALAGLKPESLCISDVTLSELGRHLVSGKIKVTGTATQWLINFALDHTILPVTARIAYHAAAYAFAHKDPYDRHILATANIRGLPLVTRDAELTKLALTCGVRVIW